MADRIRWFRDITLNDLPLVGGKTASLGEMYSRLSHAGIKVPPGFAITAAAYRDVIAGDTEQQLRSLLAGIDGSDLKILSERGRAARELLLNTELPTQLSREIIDAYRALCQEHPEGDVAVRSSATAEDLPTASFAGQQESFLNVRGEQALLEACRRCFASLFMDRAISYRLERGFDHFSVSLSVAVQRMVRSDLGCSGVIFTIDPESGFRDVVLISGVWGLGETIVQGTANPDEFYVFKPTLKDSFRPIITRKLGLKQKMHVYGESTAGSVEEQNTPDEQRSRYVLSDEEVLTLARWSVQIEDHYSKRNSSETPMDIEWAKDGRTGELFILQARPETVVSQRSRFQFTRVKLKQRGEPIVTGSAVGDRIASGPARVVQSVAEIALFQPGEILVTETTDPDWEPIMKIAAGIVTNHGGRTSHAAIVGRELGLACVVGATDATRRIKTGDQITVSCAQGPSGYVYRGNLPFETQSVDLRDVPTTRTRIQINVGDPDAAFALSFLPHDGVGLAREEFIVSSAIKIHPRALLEFDTITDPAQRSQIEVLTKGYSDKRRYYIEKLSEGIARIAAGFYPKPVILRLADFKSNEYAHLIGGQQFEPHEENPMLGWRGASRYYHESYRAAFAVECEAIKRARTEFGLKNIAVMVPFCRTVEEGKKVVALLEEHGLQQHCDGLELYVMCEIPSNVLLAEEFLDVFDGFSIGSNDLTQLTLGVDRDSELVAPLFDERNPAVLQLIRHAIEVARRKEKHIGICGDAPSTYEDFAQFLVQCGIESISVSPDAFLKTKYAVAETESQKR